MLHDFIRANRSEILARARARVVARMAPQPSAEELDGGLGLFLDQLIETLRLATALHDAAREDDIEHVAAVHGEDMLKRGFNVAQVVHDYGDLCQVVTELALESEAPIATGEFRTLNRCLDHAIAGAVTAYSHERERALRAEETERLGVLAHELRNYVATTMLSFEVMCRGLVAPRGNTAALITRNLHRISDLVDRSLAEVRLDAGICRRVPVSVRDFVDEVALGALTLARASEMRLSVLSTDAHLWIEVDPHSLASALSNLLQNAFKFNKPGGCVVLRAFARGERALIEVADECGGLPPGKAEEIFRPFQQRGANRTGLGLGLTIARRAVEANAGKLTVSDHPGRGCVFVIDLPLHDAPLTEAPQRAKSATG